MFVALHEVFEGVGAELVDGESLGEAPADVEEVGGEAVLFGEQAFGFEFVLDGDSEVG